MFILVLVVWCCRGRLHPERRDMSVAGAPVAYQDSVSDDNQDFQTTPSTNASVQCLKAQRGIAMDETSNVEHLRWVGNYFLYFLDIPCVDITKDGIRSDDAGSSQPGILKTSAWVHTLVEGLMNTEIPVDCLVSRDENGAVISGDHLARLLVPWARRIRTNQRDLAADEQHRENAKLVLKREIWAFDEAVHMLPEESKFDGAVSLALATFLVSICSCAEAIWGKDEAFSWFDNTWFMGKIHVAIHSELNSRWGSHAPNMEQIQDGGVPFVCYAIYCQPSQNKHSTQTVLARRDASSIPHVTPDCNCPFVKPSLDAVRASLLADDVPAVVFDGTSLAVCGSKRPYVAISHVWADGLGSCTEIGFPRCQIERLDRIVRTLVPDGALWHDGLCVPSPTTERPAWQRAIKLLGRTYAGAEKVLVVDGCIRTQASRAMPKEECLLRIATSGWMQRIWTLQEGLLARELYFEVADGVVDCSHFDGDPFYLAARLVPTLAYRGDEGKFQRRMTRRPRCELNDLIRLLRLRSTSCPEDEPLAMAGLLGVDAEKLSALESGEERMKTLLLEVGRVPRNLVLNGWKAERLSIPNFTWAPATLTKVLWAGDPDDLVQCTEDGVLCDFNIVRFPSDERVVVQGIVADADPKAPDSNADAGILAFGADGNGCFNLRRSLRVPWELPYNGFLSKPGVGELRLRREYAVAVVRIMPETPSFAGDVRLTCKYLGPGSVTWTEPLGKTAGPDVVTGSINMAPVRVI